MKNKILAILGGTVTLFGLGYLIYVVMGFHALNGPAIESISASEINIPVIILMEVLYACLITLIFSKWAQIKTFSTGAQAGFIIGAIIGGCSTLELFATTSGLTNIVGVISAAITFGIRFAIAGGVIGWLLGRE